MFAVERLNNTQFTALRDNLYKPPHGRAVYGGQVIAQAMVVARNSVEGRSGFYCNSIHCYFLLPGVVDANILYTSKIMRTGNSFVWVEISGVQNDKEIFRMMASFTSGGSQAYLAFQTAPRFLRSKLPTPDALISVENFLSEVRSSIDETLAVSIIKYSTYPVAVQIKIPHRAFLKETSEYRGEGLGLFDGDEFTVGDKPIIRRMWMRVTDTNVQTVHDIPALLAFLSDWPLLGTAVVPYGRTMGRKAQPRRPGEDKELQLMASLDHAMWFHGNFAEKLEDWWLFEMRCVVLRDGRATIEGHMWAESGLLLATMVQEGVVRVASSKL